MSLNSHNLFSRFKTRCGRRASLILKSSYVDHCWKTNHQSLATQIVVLQFSYFGVQIVVLQFSYFGVRTAQNRK